MGNFIDHPVKGTIREQWCKPLLTYLHKYLGYKLVYLGLPGIDALDIISWISVLDKIIAFECGDYSGKDDKLIIQNNMAKLNEKLSAFERRGALKTYSLYQGFIEEIVLRGTDKKGIVFSQKDVVSIYNLDFCNSLTVPHEIFDAKGNISKHYKIEVIRKLLEIERDLSSNNNSKKFIMFLTVNSMFWKNQVEGLKGQHDSVTFNKYLASYSKLRNDEMTSRLLKLYTFYVLKSHFSDCQFTPDFLPPIYYKGIGNNQLMMCFTVLGTFCKNPSASAPFTQLIEEILANKLLSADENRICEIESKNIIEKSAGIDPVSLFQKTSTFQKIWDKKRNG
jgi:hypothetical protein